MPLQHKRDEDLLLRGTTLLDEIPSTLSHPSMCFSVTGETRCSLLSLFQLHGSGTSYPASAALSCTFRQLSEPAGNIFFPFVAFFLCKASY